MTSRIGARALAILIGIAALVPGTANAETYSTFQSSSEGCSGGGTVCGSYPLLRPTGSATYEHQARSDGFLEIQAEATGGLPACVGPACPGSLARFHAEAAATVWIDVATPAASALDLTASYRWVEAWADAEDGIGDADASLTGSVSIAPAPGPAPACSDGSEVTGASNQALGIGTAVGPGTLGTHIACSGTLLPATWRVTLTVRGAATSAGGGAEAAARAALDLVTLDAIA